MVLGGVAFGVVTAVAHDVGLAVGGAACAAAGFAVVAWARARYREMLAEVCAKLDGYDPGPSPVSWVDDAVWRDRNAFSPELDAPVELMSEVDANVRPFAADAVRAFEGLTLRPVSDEERSLCPPGTAGVPGPVGTADELLAMLRATPGRLVAVGVRWPVCCGALPKLVWLEGIGLRPSATFLGERGPDDDGDRGQVAFVCGGCGRAWSTDLAWGP
jgi:hypothetical protein